MYLENPEGLWMGISLILLVLLYLLRPKSKEVLFTSIMFLDEQKKAVHKKLFGAINKNIFFYLQIMVLTLLVLSASNPIIEKSEEGEEKQITIIDISASTSIPEIFEKIISAAKENLAETNTLIVAENVPILLAEEKNFQESKEHLNELTPKHTRTNLRGSLNYALSVSESKNYKKIVIISDFLTKEKFEDLIESAKKKKIEVKVIKIENKRENVGIIDLIKKDKEIKVIIKNHGNNKEMREIVTDQEQIKIELEPKEKKTIELSKTTKKVELFPKDDFSADDTIFVSEEVLEKNSAVVVSDERNKNLEAALEAIGFEVKYEKPPIINTKADVIIFDDANYDKLVPGTFEELRKKVEEGNLAVFNFVEKMPKTELVPIDIKSIETEQETNVEFNKEIFQDLKVKITKKHIADSKKDTTIIAKDEKNNPIITYKREGKGIVVYNGISKEYLENSPEYPLFWRAIVKIAGKEKKEKMYKTGEVIRLDKTSEIKTPTTKTITDSILLDEIGIYEIGKEKIVVNLLSEDESDLENENLPVEIKLEEDESNSEKEGKTEKIRIEKSLLLIAISILLFELYFAFKRGII